MGKIMEKFTDSAARKIWNQMEEEQRKCKESKIQTITEKQIKELDKAILKAVKGLSSNEYQCLLSIKGIGPVFAARHYC